MANNSISVQTDDLLACADQYRNLANQYNTAWTTVENKLQECREYWQGSFSTDFDEVLKSVQDVRNKIYDNTTQLADFITTAVQHYIDVDRGIAQRIDESHSDADYPDTVKASVHIKNDQELRDVYNRSAEAAKKLQRNPDGSVSCAALTREKAIANGFNVDWSGDGKNVYGNIYEGEHSNFTAKKYKGTNCLNDMIAAEGNPVTDIVISFPRSPKYGDKFGHVIYIDQIVDGKVYFSDNGSPNQPRSSASISEFLSRYASSNGSPIGCVHLKKK